MVVDNDVNFYRRLAKYTGQRERGSVAAGACETTEESASGKSNRPRKKKVTQISVALPSVQTTHTEVLSPEQQRLKLEQEARFESFRGTEADDTHPEDRGFLGRQLADIEAGIALPGPDPVDHSITKELRQSKPK